MLRKVLTIIVAFVLVFSCTPIAFATGDKVLAENPETGESEYKEVVQVFENETDELIHISINDETITTTPARGGISILLVAMLIFLSVCFMKPNAYVNLQGKQSIPTLPYDDALVYTSNINGKSEYRICDLNAYKALKKYVPEMEYDGVNYAGQGEKADIELKALGTVSENVLNVKKNTDESIVHLNFKNIKAESFTVDDGITTQTYKFDESEIYVIVLHSDCVVTLNGGNADVEYIEVLRDYESLIPSEYENDTEKLHFNLWLTAEFHL